MYMNFSTLLEYKLNVDWQISQSLLQFIYLVNVTTSSVDVDH